MNRTVIMYTLLLVLLADQRQVDGLIGGRGGLTTTTSFSRYSFSSGNTAIRQHAYRLHCQSPSSSSSSCHQRQRQSCSRHTSPHLTHIGPRSRDPSSSTILFSMTMDPRTGAMIETDENEQNDDEMKSLDISFVNGFASNNNNNNADNNGQHQPLESMTMAHLSAPHPDLIDSSTLPTSNGESSLSSSSSNSQSAGQKQGNRRRRRKRNKNEAMGDTAFLRKRTSDLLQVTSPDECDAFAASSCEESLRRGGMKVGLKTFNFLIDAWAFSGELDAADQALRLLNRMEEMYYSSLSSFSGQEGQEGNEFQSHDDDGLGSSAPAFKICPDVRSYTKVINALSRSMRPDSGEIAEQILDRMESVYSSGENPTAKPNTFTYVAAIEAHANSGVDGSPQKTEEMLERMIEKYQNGDPDIRPNARCFNAAINAYAKSDQPDAAQQAEFILNRMDGMYMSGLEEAKPNSFNYNSLITAWANSGGDSSYYEVGYSAEKAAEILERMEQSFAYGDPACQPTTVSFNAVIDAYAKSGLEDAAERAEQVLRRMEDLYEAGELDVKPNTRSFNSVINAWAKSSQRTDAAEKAQDLLDFMTHLYELGNDTVRPDAHSFCTVINAYARSQMSGKAERANNLFRAMKDAYKNGKKNLRPNVIAVNAVMNACAFTSGDVPEQNRAMEIAHGQLRDLENGNYGSPDHVTYGTFLKVCANQMPDCSTRQQIIEVIFQKSSRTGQVGNLVLQQMRAMGPPELYYHLIGRDIHDDVKMEDLPREWWCNVVEGKWRRRRNLGS